MLYQTMPVHTMLYQVGKRTSFWASGMDTSPLGELSAQVGSEVVGRASQEGQDQTPLDFVIAASQRPQSHYIITLYLHYIYVHTYTYIYPYNITDGYKWLIQKQETQRDGFYWHPLEELHVNEPWKTRRNRTSTPRRSRWPWQILGLHPDSVSFLRSFSWFCRSQTEVPLNILKLIQ